MIRKGIEGENPAGDDFHPSGAIQAGGKNGGQVRAGQGLPAFQAYELDGAEAGEGGDNVLPLTGGELLEGRLLDAAVTALERTPGSQSDIQNQASLLKAADLGNPFSSSYPG